MRNAKLLSCVVAVVIAVAGTTVGLTSASAAGPVRHHALTHTARIVARPVTDAGRVAPGYHVANEGGSIDCRDGSASPVAVARNILYCSPDAAYAIACYPWSPHPHYALCLRNARTRTLAGIRHTGAMPQTLPPTHPTPLDLTLANGAKCSLRAGGTSAILHQHPGWQLYYYCNNGQAIWGPNPYGVNTSHAVWTVRTARSDGTGTVRTRNVAKAWFVGRHS
jgi:hypothetical protein